MSFLGNLQLSSTHPVRCYRSLLHHFWHLPQCKLWIDKSVRAFCKMCNAALLDVQTTLPPGLLRGRSLQGADSGLLPRAHSHQRHSEIQKFGEAETVQTVQTVQTVHVAWASLSWQLSRSRLFCFAPSKTQAPSKAVQSCCGGQTLYDSETHGCCLEKGPQVEKSNQNHRKDLTILNYFDLYFDAISNISILSLFCIFLDVRGPCNAVEDSERWAATRFCNSETEGQ